MDSEYFLTHGYGGFGYDTSHVPRDEAHSSIYTAAMDGDLAKVQQALALSENKLSSSTINGRLKMMNHARRWTEIDYRMSGFTKEYKWFDRTPLMIAVVHGRADVVQFLLKQGADPTLAACPREDYHVRAIQEAEMVYTNAKERVVKLKRLAHSKDTSTFGATEIRCLLPPQELSSSSGSLFHYQDCACHLLDAEPKSLYIKNVIQTALTFWESNRNTVGAHYDPERCTSQLPRNMNAMLEALDALGECPQPTSNKNDKNSSQDEDYQQVLDGLLLLKKPLETAFAERQMKYEETERKNAAVERQRLEQEHARNAAVERQRLAQEHARKLQAVAAARRKHQAMQSFHDEMEERFRRGKFALLAADHYLLDNKPLAVLFALPPLDKYTWHTKITRAHLIAQQTRRTEEYRMRLKMSHWIDFGVCRPVNERWCRRDYEHRPKYTQQQQ
jgi:signal transduction histidine kinase